MELNFTHKFKKDYKKLSPILQKQVDAKMILLISNLPHPSLRVKKVKGCDGVYEGSVNMYYRLLFLITEDAYIILRVGAHNILEK